MDEKTDQEFETVSFKVDGVANGVAKCEDIVLREGATSRLIFRAKMLNMPGSPESINGVLFYQKKSAKTAWDECEIVDLRKLKAGQGVAINLKSADVALLRQSLHELQWIVDVYGVERDTRFVGVRENIFSEWTRDVPVEVIAARSGREDDVTAAIKAVLQQSNLLGVVQALSGVGIDELMNLRGQIGVTALDQLIVDWKSDDMKNDEEYWQKLLSKNSFALAQVFYSPTVVVGEKVYVGGKGIDNRGGSLADFLLKNMKTGSAKIVEIKTPSTVLLQAKDYRNGAYGPSKDLGGALAQVLEYRDRLIEQMPQYEQTPALRRALPTCAVIIGHQSELSDDERRRSFENFRHRTDVVILTFDEVLGRLEAIRDVLRNVTSSTS